MDVIVSTDPEKLDIDFIHSFLTTSYWAKGRTKKEVIITIQNCVNFGVYLDGNQIGFARVLTDYTVFGYLMDVFITEEHRGKGYSKLLMQTITNDPRLQQIKRWMLITKDAHNLYKQFDFKKVENPSIIMEKLTKTSE
ncbi:GNAT family N-acetyltransferase [Aquimarina sp. AU474]|uniref:GNAT family N-acetyltransferase n=1 Tax=Aquimarina sp. AU474 TaxID=2108529 RepID=UPI000D69546A|nr:GNAT family N-acetyltransferase [Aquimarina sp. AU474]